MIIKYFDLKKKINENINLYLLYWLNTGLIEETINNTFKPIFSKNIFNYDESEIIANIDEFKQNIFNKSFFENDKLIIINRGTDKILKIISELIEKKNRRYKYNYKIRSFRKKIKIKKFFWKR